MKLRAFFCFLLGHTPLRLLAVSRNAQCYEFECRHCGKSYKWPS